MEQRPGVTRGVLVVSALYLGCWAVLALSVWAVLRG
jgi:hypothetical protein